MDALETIATIFISVFVIWFIILIIGFLLKKLYKSGEKGLKSLKATYDERKQGNKNIYNIHYMRKKYNILISYMLTDPSARISKEKSDYIQTTYKTDFSTGSFSVLQRFGKIVVTWDNYILGEKQTKRWEFPEEMDQYKMVEDIGKYMSTTMELALNKIEPKILDNIDQFYPPDIQLSEETFTANNDDCFDNSDNEIKIKVKGLAKVFDSKTVDLNCELIYPNSGVTESRIIRTDEYNEIEVDSDMIITNFELSSNGRWLVKKNKYLKS